MQHTIRGSDVFVKEDLRSILDGLSVAARHQPIGQFRDGFLAALDAVRTSVDIRPASPLDDWHVVEDTQIVEVRR
jgi:hypothetical protein